jgi:hypothetical protein
MRKLKKVAINKFLAIFLYPICYMAIGTPTFPENG